MMQTSPRYGRASQSYRRSGYEPSDTETDFQESPWRDHNNNINPQSHIELVSDLDQQRNKSPLKSNINNNRRLFLSSRFDHGGSNLETLSNHRRRHNSKSPYKPRRDEQNIPRSQVDQQKDNNYHPRVAMSKRTTGAAVAKRSATAPRQRQAAAAAGPTSGEINERVAYAKLGRELPAAREIISDSTDSTILAGDIFFSREWTVLALPKKKGGGSDHSNLGNGFTSKPNLLLPQSHNKNSSSSTNMFTSSGSRQASRDGGSGRFSTESSKFSETTSTKTTESARQFTANRRKSQKDAKWFGCVKKSSCRSSKSPERTKRSTFNETLYIEKAFVVEKLRRFWADKYQPCSLIGFTCHKQEAQLLKQLVSDDICPHILLKGPNGSGKRSLALALLREIFGDASSNVSHDIRHFQIQENKPMQVAVPVTSSAHHLELNVRLEPNAKYALMGLVREITKDNAIAPEISTANLHSNYKVIVLYDVEKATDNNIQHLIKWIMDCYTDSCKLILCCEDDSEIIESVTNRCKVININSPVTHEIMEVLIQISRKEDFELSTGFAAKIAIKSKQNLRKAIMGLEACKAHNYPFIEDQPIPIGWEEVLVEMAAEILVNPAPATLFHIRGRFQKLLADFVHPKLILQNEINTSQKLVEQFLKGIDAGIKRELYYWHAYYDKRVPTGASALLKLEEFVAKFMSISRRSSSNNRQLT